MNNYNEFNKENRWQNCQRGVAGNLGKTRLVGIPDVKNHGQVI